MTPRFDHDLVKSTHRAAGMDGWMRLRFVSRLAVVTVALALGNVSAGEVRVAAAASLNDVLRAIGADYQKSSGDTVRFQFGGSNLLARQIIEGAPVDVFLSADEARMDALEKGGHIDVSTRRPLLTNTLVIVVPARDGAPLREARDLRDPRIRRLALADPAAVPAGIYARQFLEKSGLWESVNRKVVPTENVRAALAAVEAGNADAAIVYRTDAAISTRVRIAADIGIESPRISYPVAVMTRARNPEAARRFAAHLETPAARAVFRRFGFGLNQR
jgi:molybdate transport system substrate-binding protein